MKSLTKKQRNFYTTYALSEASIKRGIDRENIIQCADNNGNIYFRINGDDCYIKLSYPARLSKANDKLYWDFDMRDNFTVGGATVKQTNSYLADYYLLIGLDNCVVEKIFLVPASKTPKTHLRIPVDGKSKYDEYRI